jgi:hypothetical protein
MGVEVISTGLNKGMPLHLEMTFTNEMFIPFNGLGSTISQQGMPPPATLPLVQPLPATSTANVGVNPQRVPCPQPRCPQTFSRRSDVPPFEINSRY